MTLIFFLLIFIFLLILLIGGRVLSVLLGFFSQPFRQKTTGANKKDSTPSAHRGKVDMQEVNLRRFDKDQGEYVDFEEEKDKD
ncbi:hypothetical protein HQ36_02305 [Porphyromonas gingivicanis]|uniref:DUF4834 domain-containing protein n=1 Tax=Porphyromonas gingivicanis TaxID=266762 RepID=A0A0A2G5G2_9PORP|nr:hypothetical protein [Porphyromonas gingivicanis]KGN98461.1 hypothetical protein HQ36_02305 [Porphyromonas gingivicanis]